MNNIGSIIIFTLIIIHYYYCTKQKSMIKGTFDGNYVITTHYINMSYSEYLLYSDHIENFATNDLMYRNYYYVNEYFDTIFTQQHVINIMMYKMIIKINYDNDKYCNLTIKNIPKYEHILALIDSLQNTTISMLEPCVL